MHDDRTRGTAAETVVVESEVPLDERWATRTSGGAARAALTVGSGALLFSVGAIATRALVAELVPPPWVGIALYMLAGAVAIAGMLVVARAATASAPLPGPVGVAGTRSSAAPRADPGASAGSGPARPLERFQVEVRGGRRIVAAGSVEWIQARGNYARLHLPDTSFLYRMPLAQLERELEGRGFMRVHRSAIVRLDAIARVEPLPSGDAELWLTSGARVRLSRRYAKAFHERTGRAH